MLSLNNQSIIVRMPLELSKYDPVEVARLVGVDEEVINFIERNREDFQKMMALTLVGTTIDEIKLASMFSQFEEARDSFNRLLDVLKDAVVVLDDTGAVLEWNQAAKDMFGYQREEVVGQNLHGLLRPPHGNDDGKIEMELGRFGRTGGSTVMNKLNELWARRKDGSLLPIELGLSAMRTHGRWHALGVIRDMTARKEEERKMALFNQFVVEINAAGSREKVLGICLDTAMELVGAEGGIVYLIDNKGNQVRVAGRGVALNGSELEGRLQSGELVEKHLSIGYKSVDSAGLKIYFGEKKKCTDQCLAWLNNIVSQAGGLLESLRVAARTQQAQRMEAIGQLAGGVAHDFNNLLTVIMGNLQLIVSDDYIAADDDTGYRQEVLADVSDAVARAKDLTGSLLTFSKRQVLERVLVDPAEYLTREVKLLKRMMGDDIVVRLSVASDCGTIKADVTQLQQILMNLAANSRHAMPDGGLFSISAQNIVLQEGRLPDCMNARAGSFLCIAVADTGVGISPEDLKHIFEPFFTTKGEELGTGLGLANVYGLMAQHQGFVEVGSQRGEGTVFRLFFPLEDESSPRSIRRADQQVEILRGKGSILVVEDERAVARVAERVLSRCGYRVTVANSPKEAMRMLQDNQMEVDLILTDVMMPGQSGDKFIAEVRQFRPDVKVLFMSGNVERSMDGIPKSDFIPKPFSNVELAAMVRRMLGQTPSIRVKP